MTVTRTDDCYDINGVMVRRWEGHTAGGVPVDLIVQSVRPKDESGEAALARELDIEKLERMPPDKPDHEWTRADWIHHTGTEGPFT